MESKNYTHTAIIHSNLLRYPNYPYDSKTDETFNDAWRRLFYDLGLDVENFETPQWNPLGTLIKPGNQVLLKPNWVMDYNPIDLQIESLITHSSIIKTMIDYVIAALNGTGRIIIADAPLQMCDFGKMLEKGKCSSLIDLYRDKYPNIEFVISDLRKTVLQTQNSKVYGKGNQVKQDGDPLGYTLVDLGTDSLLEDISERSIDFRVTCYDHNLLNKHHYQGKHEYLISNSILHSDIIINLAKMKCHKKAGLTGALKNLIGINGHKEFLPHHIKGSTEDGGDQYRGYSRLKKIYNKRYDKYWSGDLNGGLKERIAGTYLEVISKFIRTFQNDGGLEGSWPGNDTIPRTTIDLNHIAYYYDTENQKLSDTIQRPSLHIVDGIVSGEGSGPLRPEARNDGILVAGFNPVLVDRALACFMGYDPLKIKTLFHGIFHPKSLLVDKNKIRSDQFNKLNYNGETRRFDELPNLNFKKPDFWNQAEIDIHAESLESC